MTSEQRANLEAMSGYFRALADRKRAEPADDLITFLVQAEDEDDRLDDIELLSMIFILYVAGHITTVNLIGNGVVALLSHPDELAKVAPMARLRATWLRRLCAIRGPRSRPFLASPWRRSPSTAWLSPGGARDGQPRRR